MAYEMYYEKNGTYQISGAGDIGLFGGGTGNVNESYGGAPSLISALINTGYLSSAVRDPGASEDWNDYYVRYSVKAGPIANFAGICIHAKLESPNSDELNEYAEWTDSSKGAYCETMSSRGYNYVVGHFK